MHVIKKLLIKTTGYWLHKQDYLPVGADLFVDLHKKIRYPSLDVFFDVGANSGQTWKWFRNQSPNAMIFCFEPVLDTYSQLQKNTLSDRKTVVENLALGDKNEEKTIRLFGKNMTVLNSLSETSMNNSPCAKEEVIRVETLDHYCQRKKVKKIDLLKIDTEGYEMKVLTGAKQMMHRGAITLIYCETGFLRSNKRNTYFSDLTEFLAAEGYFFFGLYQVDYHDWKRGNNLGNALYVHKSVFP